MPRKINLADAFSRIDEHYQPRIAGEVNEFQVKIVKVEGEMIVVPHGVEHCPDVPEGEAHVLLIERAGTPTTGSAGGERTVEPVPLESAP